MGHQFSSILGYSQHILKKIIYQQGPFPQPPFVSHQKRSLENEQHPGYSTRVIKKIIIILIETRLPSLEGHISFSLIASMLISSVLILLVLEMILILLLLLLLFILIPNLLLQNNAIHTGFEKGAHSGSLAFQKPKTIEGHGGRRTRKVGQFIGELRT
jgi:hypothetical protein